MLLTIVALLWLFGKRISENLALRRQDVWFDNEYMYVRFTVSKKRKMAGPPVRKKFLKRIRLTHPYVKHVRNYVEPLGEPDKLLFSLGRSKVWRMLKVLDPYVYPHFFRESLATSMSEQGASVFELMHWFDWKSTQTASEYVKRGTKLTEKWSNREF
jgi:integrase